jgi:glycosyltransferase involved in cell wall biosynthesis
VRVRPIGRGDSIGARRGEVVVCISAGRPTDTPASAGGRSDGLLACIGSVLTHTDPDVPILLWNVADAEVERVQSSRALDSEACLAGDVGRELLRLTTAPDEAGAGAVIAVTAPADIVLLQSSCEVAAEWLGALRQSAYVDSRVATATSISSGALPAEWSFEGAAAVVRSRSLQLAPRLPRATGPCRYVRRGALELVGESAAASAPGDAAAFSQRCIYNGLSLVLADDVLVRYRGPGGYEPWTKSLDDRPGAVERSLDRVRRALKGLSVTVDARILGRPTTGTQIHILEVIAALARTENVHLSALVPDSLGDEAARSLEAVPGLTLITNAQARAWTGDSADVVHRPYQIDNPGELTFLARLGDRFVITHQDLIGYHNPSYFSSRDAWQGYRELTRTALAIADRVLFFSAHARDDALDEELVEPGRASVVHLGVDHPLISAPPEPVSPEGASRLPPDAEVMLCIGNDYRHKNRLFALRLLDELRGRRGWPGWLVLAGPRIAHGSSAPDERRLLTERPQLSEAVLELGHVSEAEKEWLLGRARVVLYPSVYEGFGLVPFEAAARGVPCMWAPGTSLSELLADDAASIEAWNPQDTADRALTLLRDPSERRRNVDAIQAAGARLTWDDAAARLLEVYEATCDAPATPASSLHRLHGLTSGALSEDAARLLGPGGALPADLERPLLALATHPRIADPLFGALKLGYRTSYKLRRRWGRDRSEPHSRT